MLKKLIVSYKAVRTQTAKTRIFNRAYLNLTEADFKAFMRAVK